MNDAVGARLPAIIAVCNLSSPATLSSGYQSVFRLAHGQQCQPRNLPYLLNQFFSLSDSDFGILSYETTTLGPEAYFEAVTIANAKSSSSFLAAGKRQVSTRKEKPPRLHKRSGIVRAGI